MRWLNQSQPQTLYSASMLAYFRTVMILLFSERGSYRFFAADVLDTIGLAQLGWDLASFLLAAGLALGGLGVANERKWGYRVLMGAATYAVVADIWWMIRIEDFGLGILLRLMFDAVLVVLIVHPMSREYRKVWFR